jgi:hypothetical protein
MKRVFGLALATTMVLIPAAASAGERVNDMALGAASGAIVAGPVGLVAGGVIGYVAGPDIGHGLGLHRSNHRADHHRSASPRRSDSKAAEAQPEAH